MTDNIVSSTFVLPAFVTNLWRTIGRRPLDIPSVEIHEVETNTDRTPRTLKHLLKANHMNHALIHNELRSRNHLPHILCSSYLFGADRQQLQRIYEVETEHEESWEDSPGEITKADWREFFGRREYQRAFVDFFEDRMVEYGYDWRRLVDDMLYSGPRPLINAAFSGLGQPLVHLAYAIEFDSREMAIEALSLIACFYSDIHKYLDEPQWTNRRPAWSSKSLREVLNRVREDTRFNGFVDHPGADNLPRIFRERENELIEWWNAWDLSPDGKPDMKTRFEESQRLAAALLVGSVNKHGRYDRLLAHVLTTSHAVRVLLPLTPPGSQLPLLRQWYLFLLAVYIAQGRPAVESAHVAEYDLGTLRWKNAVTPAVLEGDNRRDPDFVKACRSLQAAGETWVDQEDSERYFEKAAVMFATDFKGWHGEEDMRELECIPSI